MSLSTIIQPLQADGSVLKGHQKKLGEFHDYLSDSADPDNKFWEFRNVREVLSKIKVNFENTEHGIYFSALWVGCKAKETHQLNFNEFERLFLQNKIGTQSEYFINHD